MNMMSPILYSFRRCPYAMRARLALDVSGQVFELREVSLRNKPSEMLRVSAKATVPVLLLPDGSVIDESLGIMLWALSRNDPERWLTPESDSLDGMRRLIEQFDSHFKQHLDRYKYPSRFAGADPLVDRAAACQDLALLEDRLTRTTYLAGGHVSLADMAIVPFVRQFSNVDPDWFSSQSWSALPRWLHALVESARFVRIMQPVPVWVSDPPG
jgi:glutathione S-transferase